MEQWKLDLADGDRVVVKGDDEVEREYVVKYGVWKAGGRWVIGLRTMIGCYDLARVVRKLDEIKQQPAVVETVVSCWRDDLPADGIDIGGSD